MLPKRRKPEKLGIRQEPQIRNSSHLQWIRGHECSVAAIRARCDGHMEAAHVRTGTDGGTSLKPGDNWTIPLCAFHHNIQHQWGEAMFEKMHGIDMKKLAAELWQRSPHRPRAAEPTTGRRNVRG